MRGNNLGPVDKTVSILIDRSYPVVKAVYENLENILSVHEGMSSIKFVASNFDEIHRIQQAANSLNEIYENLEEIRAVNDNVDVIKIVQAEIDLNNQKTIEALEAKYKDMVNKYDTISEKVDTIVIYTDAIDVILGNLEHLKIISSNIYALALVAGDLEGSLDKTTLTDLGMVGDPYQETPSITGGYIRTVAENIDSINQVAELSDNGDLQEVIDAVPIVKASEEASAESESNAKISEILSKDWAIKTDGKIKEDEVEIDYSAKYWAQESKKSATEASSTSTKVTETVTSGISQIEELVDSAKSESLEAISELTEISKTSITEAKNSLIQTIQAEGTNQISGIQSEALKQKTTIANTGSSQVDSITKAGSDNLSAIDNSKETALEDIAAIKTSVISEITKTGETQKSLVTTEGSSQISLITSEGTKQVTAVTQEGTTQKDLVTSTGTTQVNSIKTTGSSQISSITAEGTNQINLVISEGKVHTANAKAQADIALEAKEAAIAAKNEAEQISVGIGNPLGKEEAALTYATIANTYNKNEVDAKVASVYRPRGSVANFEALPVENQVVGDVYNLTDTGANYVWTEDGWDKLSETIDLTPYLTKEEAISTYQAKGSYAPATHSHTTSEITNLSSYKPATAGTADSLATARTISFSGAITAASQSFNGTANITFNVTALAGEKVTGTVASATKAIQDKNGKDIAATYAEKSSVYTKEETDEKIQAAHITDLGMVGTD